MLNKFHSVNFNDNFFRYHLPRIKQVFKKHQVKNKLSAVTLFLLLTTLLMGALGILSLSYWKNIKEMNEISEILVKQHQDHNNHTIKITKLQAMINNKEWYHNLYYFSSLNKTLNQLIDKALLYHLKSDVMPLLYIALEKTMAMDLHTQDIDNLIDSLMVYAMFHNIEPFDKQFIKNWYLSRLDNSGLITDLDPQKLKYILDNINSDTLCHNAFQLNDELHFKVIEELNSPSVAQMLHETIISKISIKPAMNLVKILPQHLLDLLDEELYTITIPYIYTKEGYSVYSAYHTKILQKIITFAHLNKIIDANHLKDSAEDALLAYSNDYVSNYNLMLSKIHFKRQNTIGGAVNLLKSLSLNMPVILKLFQQIEKAIFIDNYDTAIGTVQNKLSIAAKEHNSDLLPSRLHDYLNLQPLHTKLTAELKDALEKNIKEVTELTTEISVTTDLDEICFHKALVFEDPKGDSPLKKGHELSRLLPSPLDSMYQGLMSNLQFLLYKHATEHINNKWQVVYNFYSDKLAHLYPLVINNNTHHILPKDFTKFFAKVGLLQSFATKYLVLKNVNITKQGKQLLGYADLIRNHWFNENGQLQIQFNIIPIKIDPDIKQVNLVIAGNNMTFTHEQLEACTVTWPNVKQTAEHVKAEFISNKNNRYGISYAGPWAWYKLLELDQKQDHIQDSVLLASNLNSNILRSPFGDFEFVINFNNNIPLIDVNKIELPNQIVQEHNMEIGYEK